MSPYATSIGAALQSPTTWAINLDPQSSLTTKCGNRTSGRTSLSLSLSLSLSPPPSLSLPLSLPPERDGHEYKVAGGRGGRDRTSQSLLRWGPPGSSSSEYKSSNYDQLIFLFSTFPNRCSISQFTLKLQIGDHYWRRNSLKLARTARHSATHDSHNSCLRHRSVLL